MKTNMHTLRINEGIFLGLLELFEILGLLPLFRLQLDLFVRSQMPQNLGLHRL
jgi:hypothetical protein